jgi:glycosyltransferase involved in cell wall biosynthesis
MKIAHFSFSTFGGAGKIARLLYKSQVDQGLDAHFFSLTDSNLHINPLRLPKLLSLSLMDQYLLSKNNNPSLVSILREHNNGFNFDHFLNNFDVIHFHWIPGLIRIKEFPKLFSPNVKFVWSIQDFWPMTGGCHFVGACTGYVTNCPACPQLKRGFKNLAQKQLGVKARTFAEFKENLTLVAPSQYVEQRLKSSSIFRDFKTVIIGNPISLEKNDNYFGSHQKYDINPRDQFVIGCVAANLSEERKNISLLINWFKSNHKNFNKPMKLLLVGNSADFIEPHPNIEIRKKITDEDEMNSVYIEMNINISISSEETFGYTILEAGIQGVASICLNGTAQSELIQSGKNGILINTIDDLNGAIESLLRSEKFRKSISSSARSDYSNKYSVHNINSKYLEIYSSNK